MYIYHFTIINEKRWIEKSSVSKHVTERLNKSLGGQADLKSEVYRHFLQHRVIHCRTVHIPSEVHSAASTTVIAAARRNVSRGVSRHCCSEWPAKVGHEHEGVGMPLSLDRMASTPVVCSLQRDVKTKYIFTLYTRQKQFSCFQKNTHATFVIGTLCQSCRDYPS